MDSELNKKCVRGIHARQKGNFFSIDIMYFLMGGGLRILISSTRIGGVRRVMRVRGREESPEDMYRTGGVNDGRGWV